MGTIDLAPLIELLDDNIDDLEEALLPLLKNALSDKAGKLPLLDRAQLYILITYAIESILFSYLRLNGVNAKEHPVFRELTRVKQYFEKIKRAESVGTNKGSMALDKAAAGRFIKHALAGNEPYDIKLAQQNEKTKVAAHISFVQVAKKRKIEDDQGATQTLPSQVSSTSSFESKESTADATVPAIGAQLMVKEGKKKRGKDSKREGKRQQSQPQKKEPDTQETTIRDTSAQLAPIAAHVKDAQRRRRTRKRTQQVAIEQD